MQSATEVLPLMSGLERGAETLREVSGPDLARAWWRATDDLEGRLPEELRRSMADAAGLSPEGLDAGLGVVVRGVRTDAARELLLRTEPPDRPLAPALVVLASNLPGLALQCLLPALAAGRPLLLKTPSAEPGFTPWLLASLTAADSRLGEAFAAASWRGGDSAVENEVLPRFERVIAYGGDGAISDLKRRTAAPDGLVDHGHRISLGLVVPSPAAPRPGLAVDVEAVARGLARDIALFDQRGCLSVHSVLVVGSTSDGVAPRLAEATRDALAALATELPPGAPETGLLAAVRAAREEAVMAGHKVLNLGVLDLGVLDLGRDSTQDLTLRHGTVVVHSAGEIDPAQLESPGLRSVRIASVASKRQLWDILEAWRGRLQGVALAGADPIELAEIEDGLRRLGVTRIAAPGRLQEVDATIWRNGGRDPLEAYAVKT